MTAFGSAPVFGADLPFGPDLKTAGWRHHEFSGIKPAWFSALPGGELGVQSEKGASIIGLDVSGMASTLGFLSWEWRVDAAVPPTDLTRKAGADRNIAIHVWFPADDGGMASAVADFFKSMAGMPAGRSLTYIWGGQGPKGEPFINPHYRDRGRMIILRPADAPTGKWVTESVDFARDYQRAFGRPPVEPPQYIAISTDSDDTATQTEAAVRRLRFATDE